MAAGDYLSVLSHGIIVTDSGGGSCDYPIESNVRYGVAYDSGTLVGTLSFVSGEGGTATTFMSHSPADILRWILVACGLGTDPNDGGEWPVFNAAEPNLPDNCITTYDTTGTDDGRSMIDGEVFRNPGAQIRIRSITPAVGWAKADQIWSSLCQSIYQDTITIGANQYFVHAITGIGNVIALGKDVANTKRNLFTINCIVNVESDN